MKIFSIDFWKEYCSDLNVHYMQRYLDFCKYIQDKGNRNLDYSERHHIVPKSICSELENDDHNIVVLSAREHYIAHWILMRAVGGRMVFAFHRLAYDKNNLKISSRVFEELRQRNSSEVSKLMTGREVSKEARKKMSDAAKGRIFSEETKLKLKEARKNRVFTDETRAKISEALKDRGSVCYTPKGSKSAKMISESNTGRISINYNNEKERHVKPEELDKYLAEGWSIGCKVRKDTRKRICVNDGIKTIRILEEELDKYLLEGWVKGTTQKGKKRPASSEYFRKNPDAMWRQVKLMKDAYNKKHGRSGDK